MTADKKTPTVVRKVRPYPIAGTIQIDGKPVKIALLYLSTKGFIARTPGLMLKVGQDVDLTAEVPVLHHWVRNFARVVKTYDRATDASASSVERLAEFLFLDLSTEHARHIERFTRAIGQKNG